VREPWEEQEARLQHFRLLPLSQASEWMPTIKETHDVNTRTVCLWCVQVPVHDANLFRE